MTTTFGTTRTWNWFATALVALLACQSLAGAATKNWNTGTGFWNTGSNWNPAGVPANGDAVSVVTNLDSIIKYDYSGPAVTLNSLVVNLSNAAPGHTTTLLVSGNTLSALTEHVGNSGGAGNANGTIDQNGGNNQVGTGNLYLGYEATDQGTYILELAASLNSTGYEYIGGLGTGTFNQIGGSHVIAANRFLDLGLQFGSLGTYNLSSGTLQAGSEYVGDQGHGAFNQTGGTNTTNSLTVGFSAAAVGTYSLSGGATNVAGNMVLGNGASADGALFVSGTGSLTVGGTLDVSSSNLSLAALEGGTINTGVLNGRGKFTFTSGTLNITGPQESRIDNIGFAPSGGLLQLDAPKSLQFASTLYIPESTSTELRIVGGSLTAGHLHVEPNSTFNFNFLQGTLDITGPDGLDLFDVFGPSGGGQFAVDLTLGKSVNVTHATRLQSNAKLSLNGGSLTTEVLIDDGPFEFNSGTLGITGALGLTIGAHPFPANLDLDGTRTLNVTNTTTIAAGHSLTLNGGTLSTGSLVNNGTFNFIGGTLNINQNNAVIATPIVTGNPSTININADGVAIGSSLSLNGFNHQGTLNVGAHTLTLYSAGYARLGALTTLNGGAIFAPNGVYISGGGNLLGNGSLLARVTGDSGSVIEATGPLAMGDLSSPAGFNYAGELRTKNFTVDLFSSAAVGLGNLTTLGNGASLGVLNAANGFVVDFDEAITGYGTINSTNTLAKHATINGTVQGTSMAQPITLSGYIKGAGAFTNVTFTGTYSPGLSPTIVTAGNMALSSTNLLIMELGGTTAGGGYDQIQTSGALALGGTLEIDLINGFAPAAGQSFKILDWLGSHSGTFSSLNLPTLSGLAWNTSQLYIDGILSVALAGDFNFNGVVDAADYVVWRKGLGTTYTQNDYNVWRAHFGQHAGSGAGSDANTFNGNAVPEPTGMQLGAYLLAIALGMSHPRRWTARCGG